MFANRKRFLQLPKVHLIRHIEKDEKRLDFKSMVGVYRGSTK